jgi:hypothetical protein
MPNVNDTFVETIKLGPCHKDIAQPNTVCEVDAFGVPTGPEFTFTYRLTRLPDVTLGPVLDPSPWPHP